MTYNNAPMRFATPGERRVATKLVEAIIRRGYVISVFDNEEWTVRQSGHIPTILSALCTTEMDTLSFRQVGADCIRGMIDLVWGNAEDGEELIADYSDNSITNEIYREVMGLEEEDT